MNGGLFDPPVFVKSGNYLIQEVISLADAIDVLEEWPLEKRDVVHETVLRACLEAQDGLRPVEVARNAFRQFAKKTGIIADPGEIMPLMRSNANFRRRRQAL